MLNFNANSGATTASNRVRRAQQLRQQRLVAAAANKENFPSPSKPSSSSSQELSPMDYEKEEEILVISGIWTVVAALFIVFLGAAMAIIFFLFYQPECMRGILWGDATSSLPAQTIATKLPPVTAGSR